MIHASARPRPSGLAPSPALVRVPQVNASPLDHFLAACGSEEPLRVGVGLKDEAEEDSWVFRQPFLLIGRRPDSDLVIDHWQVSRRHAYVQLIDGRYFCVDLGSRTGTYKGETAERSGWLEEGRALQIGPYAVRLDWPTREVAGPLDPLPGVTWELPGRALGQALWRMDRNLVLVGRSPTCRIRIVEPDVSKFHCSLVLTNLGVWVVDLLGQKGLFVNDQPIRCARLEDGDEVRVGRHVIRPRYDTPPPPLDSPRADAGLASNDGTTTVIRPAFLPISQRPSVSDLPARIFSGPTLPGWASPGGQEVAVPPAAGDAAGDPATPAVSMMFQQFGMMQQQMFDQFHQTMMMMFEGFAALQRESASTIRDEFEEVRKLSREIEEIRAETARLAEAAARDKERPRPNGHAHRPGPTATPFGPITKPAPTPPGPETDIHAQLCLRLATIQDDRQNRWQKILGMMSNKD